ncbi:DsbE family thiol:disulfide interchange protein [Candidatus Pelagibacter bacterium]|nr:DsbE family thiol:disulfide interchange protein [Candidatus Pelagibacter bacterium]
MQKATKVLIILFLIFVITIFYISLNRDTSYNTSSLINKELPEFEITFFDENKLYKKNDLKKNNYTLINFWASWCAPCRTEHPILMKLSQENNLKIFGVNFKDKKIYADQFLKELGNPYDFIGKDENGKQSVRFGIYGIPESILINKNLLIMKKFVGPLSSDDLNQIVEMIN